MKFEVQPDQRLGRADPDPEQLDYAASDVLYLHALKQHLDTLLEREGRTELAQQCFDFLPYRAQLDLLGWDERDILPIAEPQAAGRPGAAGRPRPAGLILLCCDGAAALHPCSRNRRQRFGS